MCNDDLDPSTGQPAIHDRGLGFDLDTLTAHRQRRAVLGLLGAGALAAGGTLLLKAGDADAATATTGTSAASAATSCTEDEIPTETAGPYPGDGSNGPDALTESGIVRRDLRSSFGDASGKATGVGFTFTLVLQDTTTCRPVKGLAVYAWHCDKLGRYSMYDSDIVDENYLRGVQVSDAKGRVTFRSIYPACYSGRWPHVHFEVYPSKHAATHGGSILVTSQLALPRKQSMQVYRSTHGYTGSETNLDRVSLGTDMVFSDDKGVRQTPAMTGSVSKGFIAKLVVPVDV